jgi:glutathione S-transferase
MSSSEKNNKLVVQYHEIRGLAAPLRMMLHFAEIPYEDKFADNWFSTEKGEAKKVNALANLPFIYDGNTTVTQSNAALWYIGEKCGLNGSNPSEKSRVDQIVSQAMDLRNAAVKVFYGARAKDTYDRHLATVTTHYNKFEGWFKRNGFIFSAANRLTSGDFHLWELLDQHEEFARAYAKPSIITQYPLLNAFYARFLAVPTLQGYFTSSLHTKLPINNATYAKTFAGPIHSFPLPPFQDGTEDSAANELITVGYWKIRGLAAPLRMMCSFTGAKYESKEYAVTGTGSTGFDRSSWFDAKPELKAQNSLMNLPYVKCGNDMVTQSNACVLYLARKFGLMGKTPEETARVHQVMWQTSDMRNSAVAEFYGSNLTADDVGAYIDQVSVHFTKLDGWLTQHGTKFSASDDVTAADFHLFEMLDQHEEYAKHNGMESFFSKFSALGAFYARFRALPQLTDYFSGSQHKLPINNTMAAFGGFEDYSKHFHYRNL